MTAAGRVLVVEDDPQLRRMYSRVLGRAGHEVAAAVDGTEALAALKTFALDVVVSDVGIPGMDGLALLEAVHRRDPELPVLLMTGNPTLDTATKAVEFGAFRYLAKPFDPEDLVVAVDRAIELGRVARARRDALDALALAGGTFGDRADLEARFRRALRGLWMAFQPIVAVEAGDVYAYEALLRCGEPSLPDPGALLDAAARLGRLHELGRAVRGAVAAAAPAAPAGAHLFVNLHPADLVDDDLYASRAPLTRIAERVILEITERAELDRVGDVRGRIARLRTLGYRIAIDDLGAGYAGLSAFAQLEPEVAKLDMTLVRGLDASPTKRKLVRALAVACRELGVQVVAEGVEVEAERLALIEAGCDLMQGYLFARPAAGFPAVTVGPTV